jgi:murein DD-endopeptidase MepM/ murein hydrolase activator NlpD
MRRLGALLFALALVLTLAGPAGAGDPRWVFYSKDKRHYTSPWFDGAHRIMIPFGCTVAPYYSPDPRCSDDRGFHHGIDVAMPCGTPLHARFHARVVSTSSLGPAYGDNPVLLRNHRRGWDLVIGHTQKVYVEPGDRVRKGQLFARANDQAAPDGCHLHFERRAVRGSLSSAVKPRELLALTVKRKR